MAIIQKLLRFVKLKPNLKIDFHALKAKSINQNSLIFLSLIFLFTVIFLSTNKFIKQNNQKNENNLKEITRSKDFSNLANFFISKINSPYVEIKYIIKNNDTIEKILKSYDIRVNDIKAISTELRRKKLSNIYAGRELSLIYKKLDNNSNTPIRIIFPINNTSSIEVRKTNDNFLINEKILKLYKKNVVVKNTIKNNLYSSAVNKNIEANIIVEFARIFGFEVDFQRDIRKGDWFEIFYEKFEDENGKVRDTGKIIYASMFVNGEEINLYNFKDKGEEEYYDIKEKVLQNL